MCILTFAVKVNLIDLKWWVALLQGLTLVDEAFPIGLLAEKLLVGFEA